MFQLLKKILFPAEILALIISTAGFALARIELLIVGLYGLAAIFFLNAFMPPAVPDPSGRKGFIELLATTICYKIAFIGSAVIMVGSLYRLVHLPGALEMLMIGCASVFGSVVIIALYAITKSSPVVLPALYRAVPSLLLGVYLFMNRPA